MTRIETAREWWLLKRHPKRYGASIRRKQFRWLLRVHPRIADAIATKREWWVW